MSLSKARAEETRRQIAQLQALGWYHSIELPNGEVTPGLQTIAQSKWRLHQFPIPEDLTGKRVLDIGAWDGWFSFEMERRGASVVAVDLVRNSKLLLARELLGSKIDYQVASVYDLSPATVGQFDIVLFLGVLYHLKHPLLALERVCALTKEMACIESYVSGELEPDQKPCLEFYETTELCGQFDNWVGPNAACLLAFCRSAGFAKVSLESVVDYRAHVTCLRKWETGPGGGPEPYIVCVENSVSHDHVFSASADDYVSIWFKAAQTSLTAADVFPEIGGYAVRPAMVHDVGVDGWHAILKLPLGLDPGWQEVRMRIRDSGYSNLLRIGVDVSDQDRAERSRPNCEGPLRIEIVTDGRTWERNQVRLRPGASISLWVSGMLGEYDCRDVIVRLGGGELAGMYVSETDPNQLRQVNALLPCGLSPGMTKVNVVVEGVVSPPAAVELIAG